MGFRVRTLIPCRSDSAFITGMEGQENCCILPLARVNGACCTKSLAEGWQARDCGIRSVQEENELGKQPTSEYLEQCLDKEQRTYNSRQLAAKLKQERQVNLSPDLVRQLLKKKE